MVDRISRESLSRLVGKGANHQGVAAVSSSADYVLPDEIFEDIGNEALLVVLDGVEDPRNLGAILRTVECAGGDGVFIPERRAVGLTDTVAKSCRRSDRVCEGCEGHKPQPADQRAKRT